MSTNSAPGFKKHPDHRIETQPAGLRVRVTLNGEVIADSRDAVRLEEGDYPPVFYFPRKDVRMDRLARSSHQTYCPFKGAASYYSLKDGPANAVWTYEKPYDEMMAINERLALSAGFVMINNDRSLHTRDRRAPRHRRHAARQQRCARAVVGPDLSPPWQ
jgi:uncharacterized protein (DUF427 family)